MDKITNYEVKIETQVKGLGKIYREDASFFNSLKSLRTVNSIPISLRNLAYARTQKGENSPLSLKSSYVKEGIIRTPKQILFVSDSPIINNIEQAIQCHNEEEEFYLTEKQTEKYLEQAEHDRKKEPEKRKVLISNENGNYGIPTNRFYEYELTLWAFKDKAKKYGELLKNFGIDEMPVYFSDQKEKPFARQLWLAWLGGKSLISGNDMNSKYEIIVYGTKEIDKASQKPLYSRKEVDKLLEIINKIRKGNVPFSELEKIVDFFEKLKQ